MLVNGLFSMKDPDFVKQAIREAANKQPTHSELIEQRISFVMASVSEKSGITKEQVRQAVTG